MNTFWVVTLFHGEMRPEDWGLVEDLAVNRFGSIGIEEFSIDEPEVDRILGDRSYSGGDLPQDVLDEVEDVVKSGPVTLRFFFETGDPAKGFFEELKKTILGEIQIDELPVEDWNAEWKKHYSPIVVNEKLTIVPAWEKNHQAKSGHNLFINPGMGFGTGSHETTFLCLKLFTEDVTGTPVDVLDFGSGSGILGLAALKFYPEVRVDFYDIDPEANENCFQNAEINSLSERKFRLLLPQVRNHLQPGYNVVFANILENILVEEREFLIKSVLPGGSLILSGLLRHQSAGIIEKYSSDITFVKELTKGDWSALLFRRNG
ncbi:MAG: 50S ribosomal protein L11 methyltransferase [Bdellovibrionota bacterium]